MPAARGPLLPPPPPPGGEVRVTVRRTPVPVKPARRSRTLVALDVACLLAASIPFFLCEVGLVSPVRRGFFCNDGSIGYPLRPSETVSDPVLISLGILITSLAITLGESYHVHNSPHSSHSVVRNPYVVALYKEIGAFLFGCTVGQSLTNLAKMAVGRLRPHFLAVCQPNFTHINCSVGYVEDYSCTGGVSEEKEARKSFYSGHASFAMYSMMYLVFYLQARFTWRGARLLRPLVQFVLLMLATYTGLTRISDYRHHPSDVAVGLLQGALVAYWVLTASGFAITLGIMRCRAAKFHSAKAFHVSSMFHRKDRPCHPPAPSSDSPSSDGHTDC